eukprot:TRINITY_DN13566_c0_g1_i2.p1 TRINITY_DN13566_c0_g1~~TRINITY_DN13566_c0_g1_i2.p1  ORF type:complete len:108 (+),score=10.79 TRINITY_DN13566_c0_g1_i2:71-394(+)
MELLTIIISIFIFLVGYLSGSFIGFLVGLIYGKFYYDHSERTGHRISRWFKKLCVWDYLHTYFKLEVIYDYEYDDAITNAVIAIHPHGLSTLSSIFFNKRMSSTYVR